MLILYTKTASFENTQNTLVKNNIHYYVNLTVIELYLNFYLFLIIIDIYVFNSVVLNIPFGSISMTWIHCKKYYGP